MSSDSTNLSKNLDQYASHFTKISGDISTSIPKKDRKTKRSEISKGVKAVLENFRSLTSDYKKIVSLTKAKIKFCKDDQDAIKLKTQLTSITNIFEETNLKMHGIVSELDGIRPKIQAVQSLRKQIFESTKTALSGQNTLRLTDMKISVLQGKKVFDKKSDQLDIGNFGQWIDSMMKAKSADSEIKNNLKALKDIAIKLQLKNALILDIEVAELSIIKQKCAVQTPPFQGDIAVELEKWAGIVLDETAKAKTRISSQLDSLSEKYIADAQTLSGAELEKLKVETYIQYLQITNNPLEIPVTIRAGKLFKALAEEITQPPNDERFKELFSDSSLLAEAKLKGLKIIRNSYDKGGDPSDTLISGAGPGGLMFGLMQATQNRPFTILEVRSQDKSRERENILALGKDFAPSNLKMFQSIQDSNRTSADLKLLSFFGITDRLIADKKSYAKHIDESIFEAKISDLQEAMLRQIEALQGNKETDFVHYDTSIAAINPVEGNRAEVRLKSKTTTGYEHIEIKPSLLIISEGFQSSSRQMLGIDVVKETTKSRMGFSFFKDKSIKVSESARTTKIKKSLARFTYVLKLLPRLIKNAFSIAFKITAKEKDPLDAVTEQFERALILLGTPESDYLYATLKPSEEKLLKNLQASEKMALDAFKEQLDAAETKLGDQYRDKINRLRLIITGPRKERVNHFSNKKTRDEFRATVKEICIQCATLPETGRHSYHKDADTLFYELDKLEKVHNQLMKGVAVKGRGFLNLALGLTIAKDSMEIKPMEYKKTDVVFAQVTKAERNYVKAGSTHCILTGDAESTTDPASGSGFRTTILRAALLNSSLANPELSKNPFSQGIFEWSSELSAQSMREEGIYSRSIYRMGTEKPERFLYIAQKCGVFTKEESDKFLQMHTTIKIMKKHPEINMNSDDISELQASIRTKYEPYLKTFALPETLKIPLSQKKLFDKAYLAATKGTKISLTKKQVEILRHICSKLASYRPNIGASEFSATETNYIPEAWFMPLWLSTYEMSQSIPKKS